MADTYPLLDCEDVELDGADVWAGRDGDGPRLEASLLSFPWVGFPWSFSIQNSLQLQQLLHHRQHEPQEKEKEKVGGQQKGKTSSNYSAPFSFFHRLKWNSTFPPLNHLTDVKATHISLRCLKSMVNDKNTTGYESRWLRYCNGSSGRSPFHHSRCLSQSHNFHLLVKRKQRATRCLTRPWLSHTLPICI